MSEYHNNSIFWVEANKIQPNPFQPRREFEPRALEDLADSIRQYGILQPLVVTRKEILRENDGGMDVQYELIAGERRLRASKIAGLSQIPVIIRKETDDKVKLELAIIENLQREDLNPIDRALAFEQLYKEFKITHAEIGKKMGKSRVYVSNTLRLLSLPENIKQGLMDRRITEGHTRPLLMLSDRPEEQTTLYKEIMVKKMSVRDAEKIARKIAQDKVRKKEFFVDPKIQKYEKQLSENLGTRVHIEPKENGGKITIDYFTINDLEQILTSMKKVEREQSMMDSYLTGIKKTTDQERKKVEAERSIEESTAVSFPVIHQENTFSHGVENKINNVEDTNNNLLLKKKETHLQIEHSETNYFDQELTIPDINIQTNTQSNYSEPIDRVTSIYQENDLQNEVSDMYKETSETTLPQITLEKNTTDNQVESEAPIRDELKDHYLPKSFQNAVVESRTSDREKENSPIYSELKNVYQEPVNTQDYSYNPPEQEQDYQQISTNADKQYQQQSYQNQQQNQIYSKQPQQKKGFFGKIFR